MQRFDATGAENCYHPDGGGGWSQLGFLKAPIGSCRKKMLR
jgi:hypothetical protein